MGLLDQLASAVGVKSQEPNSQAAEKCLKRPALLEEIAQGLEGKNARLAGDCAEVMTKVAERDPGLVVPFAGRLLPMLEHKNGRVRWESAHALGLTAALVPDLVARALPRLARFIREDESVIVRDYLIDAVSAWGATGHAPAVKSLPVLLDALDEWKAKHAARILGALAPITRAAPELTPRARDLAQGFADHERTGVRKAAKAMLKATGG
jgi:hypothetical protein